MRTARALVDAPPASSLVEPEAYTSRSIKGTALLTETRALLRAWQPGESPRAFCERVARADLLAKATSSRVDDVVRRVFEPRFLADGEEPARSLQWLLARRQSGPWLSQLCLLFAARADVVVRDAITDLLPAARASGSASVSTVDFERFLAMQESAGRLPRPWSSSVRRSVAQHVLHQLSDLDVLGPSRRGDRALRSYAPGPVAMIWLACDLHRRGLSDAALAGHRDWRVWQLGEREVRDALARLSHLGLWLYQGAGSTVRITWIWKDWHTVLEALESPALD